MTLNKQHRVRISVLLWLVLTSSIGLAHPGGRDSEGCHVCRTKCEQYGEIGGARHCHTDKSKPKVVSVPDSELERTLDKLLPPKNTIYPDTGILELQYEGFTVWLDCEKRAAIKFRYNAQRDVGTEKRARKFRLDPDVPDKCQQWSAGIYKPRNRLAPSYDRGHLVPANHLDHSKNAIQQSNFMTNILPQVSTMNRGSWLRTEEIVECYRDIDELLVIGGVIWGDNPIDDHFTRSHGIKTPDAFWKVVIRGNGRVAAWVVPNSVNATKKNLDQYLVSVREIEQRTGEKIPVDDFRKDEVLTASWVIPLGCDRS